MNKVVKKTGKVLLWILAVLIVIILALPLWISPVVRGVANSIVPDKTKTTFNLGQFGLNPYSGKLSVGQMNLGNPEGYGEGNAVELGSLNVDVETLSLMSDKIHVESIDLDGLMVCVSKGTGGNFKQIAANASGEEEPVTEEKPVEEEKKEESAAEEETSEGGKKVVIDRLSIKNLKIKMGVVTIPVPDFTLTDLGKEKEKGLSLKDTWREIYGAILEKAGAIGGAIGDLGKGAIKGLGAAGGATADAMKNAGGATADAMKNAGGATVDAMKNVGGATADAMKNAGGATVDAMKNAGGALKGLFKKD